MTELPQLSLRENILGYDVYAGDTQQCVAEALRSIEEGRRSWLACLNPHSYAVSLERPKFAAALRAADWLVPDGIGVVVASRAFGGTIRDRITGSDVFKALNDRLEMRGGGTVYLLGSTDETLGEMVARMGRDWPSLIVAGSYAPPFRDQFSAEDRLQIVERVNQAAPDVLWVGLSAPKQEELIHLLLPDLEIRFAAAIGAVFDFYSGRVRRSHPALQRFGLEWLPRLVQQPRRLWRRMFVSAPVFVWHVLRRRLLGR